VVADAVIEAEKRKGLENILKDFGSKYGSFHETAKVVNSLRVSTAGITQ
jgi:hypothetical protein